MSIQRTKDIMAKLFEANEFKVGDVVEWKDGLQNKRSNGPFVVERVYDEPIFSEDTDPGYSHFKEPLDVILAHIDDDGDYVSFHYDSRRMQHCK